MSSVLLTLLLASVAAPVDVAVVCPPNLQPTLQPWVEYRQQQGYQVAVIAPSETAVATKAAIEQATDRESLRAIVLVGDAPDPIEAFRPESMTPTWHLDAKVVSAWGSEPELASDNPYADFDADGRPDVAIGRLPVDSSAELSAAIQKIVQYETSPSQKLDRRRVNVIAGVGGFGALVDSVIETAAGKLITGGIPASHSSTMTYGSWRSPYCPDPRLFHHVSLARWNEGCMYWVYIGHGNRRQLDRVRTPLGSFPILHASETNRMRQGNMPPIAVFLACYVAAFDGNKDCLAEEMMRQQGGPIAVLGGSRVTMPYAMSVFSSYLLEESFQHRRETLGEVMLHAKRRLTEVAEVDSNDDSSVANPTTRAMLDAVARAISPDPSKLAEERLEHAQLFNLLGDPLLRLPHLAEVEVTAPAKIRAGERMTVTINTEQAGECFVEVACRRDRTTFAPPTRAKLEPTEEALSSMLTVYQRANNHRWTAQRFTHTGGSCEIEIDLPEEARGYAHVRVFLSNENECAAGASDLYIRSAAKAAQ